MQQLSPLISILIATRNRIPFCISAIESILKCQESDFELIIQDNSDSAELGQYINSQIIDDRLIYHYTSPPLSSIDNFNEVLELAKGEYVCLIGDDDGINPELFKIVRWAKDNDIKAIVPTLNAVYWWPDACKIIDNKRERNGLLQISKITSAVTVSCTSQEMRKLLKNGGQDYLKFNLPKLYHGIVKKEFLTKIKNYTGKYIGGLSPDIYISIALTKYIERIIQIDYPLTIAGICHLSTSADSGSGKHSGDLESAPHLRDRGPYIWSDQVPKFYSVETIWADSAIASLNDLKRYELIDLFDITTLTVLCLQKHKLYSKVILQNYFDNMQSFHFGKAFLLLQLKARKINLVFTNLIFRLTKKLKNGFSLFVTNTNNGIVSATSIDNIQNICQAKNKLSEFLSQESLSIDLILTRLESKFGKSK